MRTYDTKAGTHGTAPFWKSLKALVVRWLDREREIDPAREVRLVLTPDVLTLDVVRAALRQALHEPILGNRHIAKAVVGMLA